ncbi:MAG: hypothetical protein KGO96_12755 [Elusimicrobia bacterium]|nr:hypothetical protein [Elusimicrobiota bacterium]
MEGLQSDTLKLIQDTAVRASDSQNKVAFVKLPGEPSHVYAAVKADGTFSRHEAVAGPRAHRLSGLVEAIAYANIKGNKDASVVWFDECGVVVVLDDLTRRDIAVAAFTHSPQFARLSQIAESKERFTQAKFRRLLRVEFAGCTPNNLLLDWVSDCEFGSKGNSVGTITKDRSSFGRDIEEQVKSKDRGACPDQIILAMRVFDDPGLQLTRQIVCDVEIHLSEQQFELTPFPGQLQEAIDAEMANVESLLAGAGGVQCPAFRGRP